MNWKYIWEEIIIPAAIFSIPIGLVLVAVWVLGGGK